MPGRRLGVVNSMRTRLGTVLVLSLVCLAPRPAAAADARLLALIRAQGVSGVGKQ
jgi:hypothetical protein